MCAANQFALTMQAGLQAGIKLYEPAVRLTIFGQTQVLKLPGLGNVFPINYPFVITKPFTFNLEGTLGCTKGLTTNFAASWGYGRRLQAGGSYGWQAGNWSACSVDCGLGYQDRSVVCRDADDHLASDDACSVTARPATRQDCEVYCPYYYGSARGEEYTGVFNMSAAPTFTAPIKLGMRIPHYGRTDWSFAMGPTMDGFHAYTAVRPGFGDPLLWIRSTSMAWGKYLDLDEYSNNHNESVFVSAYDDGLQSTDSVNVLVYSFEPTSNVTADYAQVELSMRPFRRIEGSRPVSFTLNATKTAYFR